MKLKIFSFLILVIFVGLACNLQFTTDLDSISMTLTPLSNIVAGTATARAESENSTDGDLETAVAEATAKSSGIYITQTAFASLNDESRLATATAIAPVVAELPRYGIQPEDGYVGWIHPPATIKLHGYQQSGYVNEYPQVTAADFAIAADITWNTFNSDSGCGFMFRSNGDTNKPSQYSIIMTSTASGYIGFLASLDGELANFVTFFPSTEDHSFSYFNNATNRLAIVVRGVLIDIYTNGNWIGQVDVTQPPPPNMPRPPVPTLPDNATQQQREEFRRMLDQQGSDLTEISAQIDAAVGNFEPGKAVFTEGLLGLIGLSQSGDMTCNFNNAWLFILEK